MNLGTAQVIRANARELPLADNSVDLVVTSPPYFALRSYQDEELCLACIDGKREGRNLREMWPNYAEHAAAEHNKHHYAGQIGDEPTPAEFVASLLEVTRECARVLKPSGSLWVNLGDKYAGHTNGTGGHRALKRTFGTAGTTATGAPTKSLIGIPWRYALACIDDLGLILRAEVIWSKPNGLPESVTDRVRRSHEQWFHFVIQPRYFSAVDEIREAHAESGVRQAAWRESLGVSTRTADNRGAMNAAAGTGLNVNSRHPLGKLPGSVWTVPTEPLRVPDHLGIDHFAAFPTEWPKRIIRGWSPAGVCVECGEGRRPVVERPSPVGNVNLSIRDDESAGAKTYGATSQMRLSGGPRQRWKEANPDTLTGYACACTPFHYEPDPTDPDRPAVRVYDWHLWTPAATTPAVVLDPFGGTGTTALVAKALGRHGITVDMSADYCRLAEWRTNDRDQLAKVLGIDKAGPADDAQLDLFGEEQSA